MSERETTELTDSGGRKIVIFVMQPHEMLNLLEAAGENSGNTAWVRYATVVQSVVSIDGVPMTPLGSKTVPGKTTILANAKRLGNDGLVAVSKTLFGDPDGEPGDDPEEKAAAADAAAAAEVETAKN